MRTDNDLIWEMITEIDDKGEGLSDWEADFIGSLIDRKPSHFTEKMKTCLRNIHDKTVTK